MTSSDSIFSSSSAGSVAQRSRRARTTRTNKPARPSHRMLAVPVALILALATLPAGASASLAPGKTANKSLPALPAVSGQEKEAVSAVLQDELKKLVAVDGTEGDNFGIAVDTSDDAVVVSAPQDDLDTGFDGFGSVYVFERNAGGNESWSQTAKLRASDGEPGDGFGQSLAISGNVLVVGAFEDDIQGARDQGSAYVFERSENTKGQWVQVAKLTASNGAAGDLFGQSVDIDETTLVVGAEEADVGSSGSQGSAYVFERLGPDGDWKETRHLLAPDGQRLDHFGSSTSIDGDTIAVGAARARVGTATQQGAAYVFERDLGGPANWGASKKLTASDGEAEDGFAFSISLSVNTLVIGAPRDDVEGSQDIGSAYIFERNLGGPNNWGQAKRLLSAGGRAGDAYGISVSISGDIVIAGALPLGGDSNPSPGFAEALSRNQGGENNWGLISLLSASDREPGDAFGASVSILVNTVVVGASFDNPAGVNGRGSAYIFQVNQSPIQSGQSQLRDK